MSYKKAPYEEPSNVEAREKIFPLYQLMWIPYNAAKSDNYYKKLLRDEFESRTYTFQEVEKKLWRNPDNFFRKYFRIWLMVKKEGIMSFFKNSEKEENGDPKYYPNFYKGKVKLVLLQYKLYLKGSLQCRDPEFWYWFVNVYLRKNLYPIHRFPFGEDS